MAHHIILISLWRSGTNFHQSILRHSLTPAAILREIFNPIFPFGLESVKPQFVEALRETSGLEIDLENRASLPHFFREDPLRTLRCLDGACERTGNRYLAYTVFPEHIREHELTDILFKTDCSCVFLTRSRLARYVSLVKAEHLATWKRLDTTSLKVEISLKKFLADARFADAWFQTTAECAVSAGVPMRRISYERDLDLPAPAAFSRLRDRYRDIFALKDFKAERVKEFKQDRNPDVFQSISNAEELRSNLDETALWDYALGEPAVFGVDASPPVRDVTHPAENGPGNPPVTVRQ